MSSTGVEMDSLETYRERFRNARLGSGKCDVCGQPCPVGWAKCVNHMHAAIVDFFGPCKNHDIVMMPEANVTTGQRLFGCYSCGLRYLRAAQEDESGNGARV